MAGEGLVQSQLVCGLVVAEDGASRQIKYAFANPAAIADNAIIAAVSGKKIRVLAAKLRNQVLTTNTCTWKSGATAKSAAFILLTTTSGALDFADFPYCQHGWLETNAGEALNLALTAATAVSVEVVYIEV